MKLMVTVPKVYRLVPNLCCTSVHTSPAWRRIMDWRNDAVHSQQLTITNNSPPLTRTRNLIQSDPKWRRTNARAKTAGQRAHLSWPNIESFQPQHASNSESDIWSPCLKKKWRINLMSLVFAKQSQKASNLIYIFFSYNYLETEEIYQVVLV